MTPRRNTQANVAQRPGSSGSSTPNATTATTITSTDWSAPETSTWPSLPMKYDTGESGVPPSRLRVPSDFSVAMSMAMFCRPEMQQARREHAGR